MTAQPRRILHISTDSALGGVAEVIRAESAALAGTGWTADWYVAKPRGVAKEAAFLLHGSLYGRRSDSPFPAGTAAAGLVAYLAEHGAAVAEAARTADAVVLHDPMGLALAPAVTGGPARVLWRCHLGFEQPDLLDRSALETVLPLLENVDAIVFSSQAFVWPQLRGDQRLLITPPGIDPHSWKNRDIPDEVADPLWAALAAGRSAPVPEECAPGAEVAVDDVGTGGLTRPDAPFVLQVSRWDPLKGQLGVVRGFALLAREDTEVELVLAGPHIVPTNYPANAEIRRRLTDERAALPEEIRRRVHIWSFRPGPRAAEDLALNVLRRRAAAVVQNSLRESFGLTVTEALWKRAVVVGAAVGGIADQIDHGVNGLLTPYSVGDTVWADTVRWSLDDAEGRSRWREAGRRSVAERHLAEHAVGLQLDLLASP
ncbi:glycosyltransferase [Peterkaempfera sp. SMS 1(5)a]|uniref:glycosyltransferase n=1 Tax=Peterkaempfera podocarpi TaxID=3232308 RepID=UPI00366D3FB2